MREFLFITLFLVAAPVAHSQNQTLDSLNKALENHTIQDTVRLKIIFDLCFSQHIMLTEQNRRLAEEALVIAKKINSINGVKARANATRYLALFYSAKHDYPRAESLCYETLQILEPIQDQQGMGRINELLGTIFLEQGDTEKAKTFYDTALKIYLAENMQKEIGHLYNSIGVFYARCEKYDSAEKYHFKSFAIRKEMLDGDGIAESYTNLAASYMGQKKYNEALMYFEKVLPILSELNNQHRIATTYMNMGKLFTLTEKFDHAEVYLFKSLAHVGSPPDYSLLYETYYTLMVLEKKRGDFEKALKFAHLESVYNDSLYMEEKVNQISEIETRFETEKKNQQIKLLERDQEIELLWRNIFISAIVLISISSISIYFLKQYRERKNREILNLQIETLLSQQNDLSAKYKEVLTSTKEKNLASHDQRLLKKAIELVDNKMSDPLFSVEKMCEELGMSRTNLHRKIKAITGFPPSELIRTIRLKKAAILLRNQTDSVSQIGFAVGFDNHSYFSKAFKKHFGMSPSEYSQSTVQSVDSFDLIERQKNQRTP
jgi:AraC-like DNA-binding protein/Tfp pilus assembly protein PilF